MSYKFLLISKENLDKIGGPGFIGLRYVKSHESELIDGSKFKDYFGGYSINTGSEFVIHENVCYELFKMYLDNDKGNVIFVGTESVYGCDQF